MLPEVTTETLLLITLPVMTSMSAAQVERVCSDGSEMRGVLELQAMLLSDLARRENQIKGFCKNNALSHGQDLEKFRTDTAEALQKILVWGKR